MASSSKSKRNYDVFLSFRGTDLRNNFVSHLYQALHRNGIYTFRDSEELKKGDQISMLMKAIEESCIAVIVFSDDYASSTWCLEELSKIMECKEQKGLTVLPVFYKVEPKEVRGGRESYRRALAKHESKFEKDSEKVKRWKKALFDAGDLSGWHLNDGDESELIQKIVMEISTYLDRTPMHFAKHPIGIKSRVVELKLMLNLKSNDDVIMVGLWGQGGIGKTTLAKLIYNDIFRQFEGSCLLPNVREGSKDSKDLVLLQEKLLSEILLSQQILKVSGVDKGINLIQHRLGHKKVLLVLDDVDDLRQLNALAGEGKWFGNGSRIIITTRDKHLLISHGIDQDHVYEVKALDDNEADKLLSQHAFPTLSKLKIKEDLVRSVLNLAKGLPLALEVLGSFLCGRREHEWESTLKKYSRVPNGKINDVLRISYDGLEENEREIFLDIACFFKGRDKEYVKKVLDSCELEATIGLEILTERSLIRIGSTIQMHDLIQLMGMEIVNQKFRDNPEKRSRLWQYGDVSNVLSSNVGDCNVKAVVLELPQPTELCFSLEDFTKMRKLRLLILRNVYNSFQGPIYLPDELRWFEWPGCAHQIPKFSSGLNKLVGLDVSKGNITGVVEQLTGFQNLKYIYFSDCKSLVRMPDLSCTPKLEELYLCYCKNMVEAHESLAYHDKLRVLTFSGCSELSVFPNELKSKNLQFLDFDSCTKFERFPEIPHKLEALEYLNLGRTSIKGLPASIENLVSLKSMDINYCKNLEHLPSSIYKLQKLEYLEIQYCPKLIRFPKYEDLANSCMKTGLSNLCELDLEGCNLSEVEFLENLSCCPRLSALSLNSNNITTIPTSINKRDCLKGLSVVDCHQLQEIPEVSPSMIALSASTCKSLPNIEDLTSPHRCVCGYLADAVDSLNEHWPDIEIILPGIEMPQWIIPIKEDLVSFMVSKDLYDKILSFGFCFALSNGEGIINIDFTMHVDGKPLNSPGYCYRRVKSEHIRVYYFSPSTLWGEINFAQVDSPPVLFGLEVKSKDAKKWGFRIICKQLGDDLKAELQDNQLIDPALLFEVGYGSTDLAVESSHVYKDNSSEANLQEDSQDCQTSVEEHSQIGSKRKREFILPQGKRMRLMLTSNSTDGDENEKDMMIDLIKSLHL